MEKKPFLFAVSGVKNSGKTTLIEKLIPELRNRGLCVAVMKHDGHDFEPDVPGSDSFRYKAAGAYGSAVFSKSKYMIVKEQLDVSYESLSAAFPEADIILVEGLKYSSLPKIELVRKGNSDTCICNPKNVVAIISDFIPEHEEGILILTFDETERLAELILEKMQDHLKAIGKTV
ncbi:MAG: molybdopterin-guanine dinucleotide biosynthesis protein B [Fusicatenibacter sp.]